MTEIKMFIIVMLLFIVTSCDRAVKHKPVITAKSYMTFGGNPMPKCICRFWYKSLEVLVKLKSLVIAVISITLEIH